MKIEERITKMKHAYLATRVAEQEIEHGWQELEKLLGKQEKSQDFSFAYRYVAFAVISLFLFGGVVSFAQAAKPGELLYPVKALSEKAIEKITELAPGFVINKIEQRGNPHVSSSSASIKTKPTNAASDKGSIRQVQDKKEKKDVKGLSDNPSVQNKLEDETKKNSQDIDNGKSADHGKPANPGNPSAGSGQGSSNTSEKNQKK